MTYAFALLRPQRARGAAAFNAGLLGSGTLGVEVTEPALAARCGLGNIDPQHGPQACPEAPASIVAALDWPLPPHGARLVTLRPDIDALGAMAVLARRRMGGIMDETTLRRVAAIDAADRFQRGPWPGRRPLPRSADAATGVLDGDPAMAALAAECARPDFSLAARIDAVAAWLAAGDVPPVGAALAARRACDLIAALRRSRGVEPWLAPGLVATGRIATIEGTGPAALAVGYCLAPVVVARNPAFLGPEGEPPHVKYTIAQYRAGHADFSRLKDLLARLEAGWGGSATIVGSPQGCSSHLPLARVVETVATCMT
ncbi:MAG: hypothetical protein EPO55_00730 [Reyranella sp.]|uniref:hypothetical protein n=1 Tax=Reyranella sp. TaxID=1929291 RepID=UPI00121E0CD1|nr:hypothetical protein [Reyranella sp.]TAJ42786.1 MAG: hypothetical protein EPO55_00730 [Reyranella sp.]